MCQYGCCYALHLKTNMIHIRYWWCTRQLDQLVHLHSIMPVKRVRVCFILGIHLAFDHWCRWKYFVSCFDIHCRYVFDKDTFFIILAENIGTPLKFSVGTFCYIIKEFIRKMLFSLKIRKPSVRSMYKVIYCSRFTFFFFFFDQISTRFSNIWINIFTNVQSIRFSKSIYIIYFLFW